MSAAIAISYHDRQTLPVATRPSGEEIPVTNEQFSLLHNENHGLSQGPIR
jgi:hypothetical protein